MRGATLAPTLLSHNNIISTHAPLAGRDSMTRLRFSGFIIFQPTRPLRGATVTETILFFPMVGFQPTRPLRGATVLVPLCSVCLFISTHAPLAGRDPVGVRVIRPPFYFNPRAPCGARRYRFCFCSAAFLFQPTRPLRGATSLSSLLLLLGLNISTHAPLAGRDGRARWYTIPKSVFQPTRPLRGAT